MLGDLRAFQTQLLRWYRKHRRELPWRLPKAVGARSDQEIDPYHVLVSELMLQQTQVATVIPYFLRFIQRFPTAGALADAPEQDVLRLWQGLGYYARARNLQKAARAVVEQHAGRLPRDLLQLNALPGVGRYTAGAVASIAFGIRAPILDGNVSRVLCRIDKIESDPREHQTVARLWERAEQILPARHVGDFNSALMELGATVCAPKAPRCLTCPVRDCCEAYAAGVQERIPIPRKAKSTPLLRRVVYCIERGDRWLVEQRPATGRWAGMWQFITADAHAFDAGQVTRIAGSGVTRTQPLGQVTHALTHRRYVFDVYRCTVSGGADHSPEVARERRQWVTLAELDALPLPRPHVKIAEMLASAG